MRLLAFAVLALAASGLSGCRQLGYTNRVLLRVPAPDGRVVAVCQEIPEFDGPGFDVRLELPDGTLRRRLYQIGDGDPCSEIAWSPDGRVLAVLSTHVARMRFVDVEWALKQPSATSYWAWPQVDLSTDRELRLGRSLRFVGAEEVELTTCAYDIKETQRTRKTTCTSDEIQQRVRIPTSIRTARHDGAVRME